jgi:hypothetical protein
MHYRYSTHPGMNNDVHHLVRLRVSESNIICICSVSILRLPMQVGVVREM